MAWIKRMFRWIVGEKPQPEPEIEEKKPWRKTIIEEWSPCEKEKLREKVMEHKDREKNIILLGPFGSGKSSFTVSAASALKGNFLSIAQSRPFETSVTKRLWKTQLESSNERLKVSITDCQGIKNESNPEMDAFNLEVLKSVLEKGYWKEQDNTKIIVDAVVLVFKYREDYRELSDLQFVMDVINEPMAKNLPVFVMITHIDTAFKPPELFQLKDVFYEEKFKEAVENVYQALHIERRNILLQCNYSDAGQDTEWDKDILTLHNLWFIVSNIRL